MAAARLDPLYGSPMTVRRPENALGEDMAQPINVSGDWKQPIWLDKLQAEEQRRKLEQLEWARQKQAMPIWTSIDKIKMRLGLEPATNLNYHCNVFVGSNSVFIFVASGDKALILEDDKHLFPSDSLIGQLTLWAGSL
jgi:hypothetical protein